MTVKMDRIEKNRVALEVTVAADDFQKSIDRAFKKVSGQISIPGFRKGKVPKAVVEARIGKQAILEEAYEFALPDAYTKAVKESGIEPIDRPNVEVVSSGFDQDLVFKATVDVKPEVELGEYKGLGVEKPAVVVTDEQVENQLKVLQERHAKVLSLEEGTIEQGDTAIIDFAGSTDGVPFPGGSGTDYPLVVGSDTFIPGFEQQLLGVQMGAEVDVNVTFPEEYHAPELAGKPAVFKVNVKGIKRKELTPIDDEFAKDVSEFENLEELKADTKNKLLKTAEEKAERDYKNAIVEKVVGAASVEIPQAMIDERVEQMVRDLAQRLQYQGLSFDQYLQYAGTTVEELKGNYRPQAEQGVKTDLVLEAIAKAEDIKATEQELQTEIDKFSAQYQQDRAQFREMLEKRGEIELFSHGIVVDKTIDFLVENN